MKNQMVPMNICLSEKIGMNPRLLLITLHSHSEKEIRQKSNFSDFTFFFLSGFSFTTIYESQDTRGSGRAFL